MILSMQETMVAKLNSELDFVSRLKIFPEPSPWAPVYGSPDSYRYPAFIMQWPTRQESMRSSCTLLQIGDHVELLFENLISYDLSFRTYERLTLNS